MRYTCEKIWSEGDQGFVKVIICELGTDSSSTVSDITHHDSEALADQWLNDQWGIALPPQMDVQMVFEHD